MSFLAPLLLAAGVAAAGVVVALHLLTTRRPPAAPLPTARFVPVSEARAVSRSSRPTDLLLLALRALAVLLVGAAFARPVRHAPGPAVRTVVLLDASAGVADPGLARRAAMERVGEGGALVVFDTAAREESLDSAAAAVAPRAAPGILSAALVAGVRAARRIAPGADSVRLVLVSPLAQEVFDAATAPLRSAWPGGIELVRVPGVHDSANAPVPQLVSPLADDPLAPALDRLARERGAHAVRIVRGAPTAEDSAWGRREGRVLIHWPLAEAPVGDGVTVFGLRNATLVAPLARLAPDTAPHGAAPVRVIARWRDGAAAAVERATGAGCLRDIGIGLPRAGDLTLRPAFDAALAAIVEPCGGARGPAADAARLATLAPADGAAPAARLLEASRPGVTLPAILLAIALTLLAAEWLVRRRGAA